jgi:biopolymer transport protein ExbD
MLVLLIIMMRVAPLLQQGITVTLPMTSNSIDKPETRGQTTIAISVDKHVYLNAREVPNPNDNLGMAVKEVLEGKKSDEKVVFIKADQGVDYGVVMATMDQPSRGHRRHGPDYREAEGHLNRRPAIMASKYDTVTSTSQPRSSGRSSAPAPTNITW